MSSTTLAKSELEPVPAIMALLDIFLSPPPEVSIAISTSSLAAVEISLKEDTAIELKFVPSATRMLPAVFVAANNPSSGMVRLPPTDKSVPTNNFLAIPTPPSTIKAPEVELVESVTRFKLTAPLVSRVVTVAAAAVPLPRIPSNVPVNPVPVISPATATTPLDNVIKSVSLVCPITAPSITTWSTVRDERVPKLEILPCIPVCNSPASCVAVSLPVLGL